jgi:hypothetical protein
MMMMMVIVMLVWWWWCWWRWWCWWWMTTSTIDQFEQDLWPKQHMRANWRDVRVISFSSSLTSSSTTSIHWLTSTARRSLLNRYRSMRCDLRPVYWWSMHAWPSKMGMRRIDWFSKRSSCIATIHVGWSKACLEVAKPRQQQNRAGLINSPKKKNLLVISSLPTEHRRTDWQNRIAIPIVAHHWCASDRVKYRLLFSSNGFTHASQTPCCAANLSTRLT